MTKLRFTLDHEERDEVRWKEEVDWIEQFHGYRFEKKLNGKYQTTIDLFDTDMEDEIGNLTLQSFADYFFLDVVMENIELLDYEPQILPDGKPVKYSEKYLKFN